MKKQVKHRLNKKKTFKQNKKGNDENLKQQLKQHIRNKTIKQMLEHFC